MITYIVTTIELSVIWGGMIFLWKLAAMGRLGR